MTLQIEAAAISFLSVVTRLSLKNRVRTLVFWEGYLQDQKDPFEVVQVSHQDASQAPPWRGVSDLLGRSPGVLPWTHWRNDVSGLLDCVFI